MAHVFGTDGGSWYNFYSGIFAVLVFGGGLLANLCVNARKHNCEVHRCWRLGRHATAAGQHVCRKHHPDGHLTAQGVRERHHLYLGKGPGRG